MMPDELRFGDQVVDLELFVRPAALVTGAVSGAWIFWLSPVDWWLALVGGGPLGAAVGDTVGNIVTRVFYRRGEHIRGVKVGAGALRPAIAAGLAGAVLTAVVIPLLALILWGATNHAAAGFVVPLACGVAVAVIWGCVASR